MFYLSGDPVKRVRVYSKHKLYILRWKTDVPDLFLFFSLTINYSSVDYDSLSVIYTKCIHDTVLKYTRDVNKSSFR